MKTRYNIIILFLAALFISACDSLTEVTAENNIDSEEFLTNEKALNEYLNGAYFNLMGINDGAGSGGELFGGDFKLIADLLIQTTNQTVSWSPDLQAGRQLIGKNILQNNAFVENNWLRGYKVINMANKIIEAAETIKPKDESIIGEAYAIRAMVYFEMVKLWGAQYSSSNKSKLAIPLILKSISKKSELIAPQKASVEAIYTQIESDLKEASTKLEAKGKNGTKISYYTCQAYLALVYMQKRQYNKALPYLNKVIDSKQYQLVSQPLAAFNNASNSSEDIFAVQQNAQTNTGDRSSGTGLSTVYGSVFGIGNHDFRIPVNYLTQSKFIRPYGPQFLDIDKRYGTVSIKQSTKAEQISSPYYFSPINTSALSTAKYLSNTNVVPVLRLSELVLKRAETLTILNGLEVNSTALNDVNSIRKRAGLSALASDISAKALFDSIVVESRREMIYEGTILHDAKRRAVNGFILRIGNRYSPLDEKLILPIPQSECNVNPDLCN